jgi:hypothetical protein
MFLLRKSKKENQVSFCRDTPVYKLSDDCFVERDLEKWGKPKSLGMGDKKEKMSTADKGRSGLYFYRLRRLVAIAKVGKKISMQETSNKAHAVKPLS